MEARFQNSPGETASMSTVELRKNFLCQSLFIDGEINMVYSHYDRVIIGGAKPSHSAIQLPNPPELRASFFLERREIGIINVGGNGTVLADQQEYPVGTMDCVYLGKGVKEVSFNNGDANNPALFYFLSAPAHQQYSSMLLKKEDAATTALGSLATSNQRTIYKYIHAGGIQSAQLVMGLTVLAEGSVWNTMPPHTHSRRMEAYFYFNLPPEQRIIHLMGEPTRTRHLVLSNLEAVISPPWSVHAGCGTSNYAFIWGMAGENSDYTDMDPVAVASLL
jgi:4-deoxy-L-threo-5-hexosulose-uronate ketol-isomerase